MDQRSYRERAGTRADWFAGLVPVYLAANYRPGGIYLGARSVLMIHNLRHQGVYSPATFELLGLPGEWYHALEWQYPPDQRMGAYEEEGRAINTMKVRRSQRGRKATVLERLTAARAGIWASCRMPNLNRSNPSARV